MTFMYLKISTLRVCVGCCSSDITCIFVISYAHYHRLSFIITIVLEKNEKEDTTMDRRQPERNLNNWTAGVKRHGVKRT